MTTVPARRRRCRRRRGDLHAARRDARAADRHRRPQAQAGARRRAERRARHVAPQGAGHLDRRPRPARQRARRCTSTRSPTNCAPLRWPAPADRRQGHHDPAHVDRQGGRPRHDAGTRSRTDLVAPLRARLERASSTVPATTTTRPSESAPCIANGRPSTSTTSSTTCSGSRSVAGWVARPSRARRWAGRSIPRGGVRRLRGQLAGRARPGRRVVPDRSHVGARLTPAAAACSCRLASSLAADAARLRPSSPTRVRSPRRGSCSSSSPSCCSS